MTLSLTRKIAPLAAALLLALLPLRPASAQTANPPRYEIALYGGPQIVDGARVSGQEPGGLGAFDFRADWQGKAFAPPPHYGLRLTRWQGAWGWGVDVNHVKAYADGRTRAENGFSRLEFTDGLNIVTLNGWRRWPTLAGWEPRAGLGLGIALPHVDVQTAASRTFGYQLTGPALAWSLGAARDLGGPWALMVEYRGTRSWNDADLDGGGRLKTDLTTHALALGLAFRF